MSKRIVIVGGGIIGLSTAWFCRQHGHDVTVIDRGAEQRGGCSFGNAGMIVTSHIVPLAAPGMVRLGLRWMLRPDSPFHIRPRFSWDLIRWLWHFTRSCSDRHVRLAAPLLRDLHFASRECFQSLEKEIPGGFGLTQNGLLMLCRTEDALREERETAEMAHALNVESRLLDAAGVAEIDPGIETNVAGGIYYPTDCFLSPEQLMQSMQQQLATMGCKFHWESEVEHFDMRGDRIEGVIASGRPLSADEVVLCGGVWSADIVRQLGISLPMQAGKGYSLTVEQPPQLPSICSILTEARVAVTPMGSSLRFAGTMEIAGKDESISPHRVRGIIRSISDYYPQFRSDRFAGIEPWAGLRPCSPDGLPYLGRTQKLRNLIISTGHAMMGVSLSMASGQIVADIIDGQPSRVSNLEFLSPDRYR